MINCGSGCKKVGSASLLELVTQSRSPLTTFSCLALLPGVYNLVCFLDSSIHGYFRITCACSSRLGGSVIGPRVSNLFG